MSAQELLQWMAFFAVRVEKEAERAPRRDGRLRRRRGDEEWDEDGDD
jgi:hypothetical protein